MIYSYIFLAIVSFRVRNNCVLCIHNLLALLFELELWGDDIEEEYYNKKKIIIKKK